jgi:hypothetical protein
LAGTPDRVAVAGDNGEFTFSDLPQGTYRMDITSAGMEPFTVPDIVIHPGEARVLPAIAMGVANQTVSVNVSVTPTELAQEEVKAALQQRVLGVLPNFYSSYIWNAEPLNPGQKFNLAVHSIGDPVEFLGVGFVAATEQASDTFPAYGQGAKGYAKRYGAGYADDVLSRMLGSAVLPSLFHQDPRYFYKGSGSGGSRFLYAVSRAVITRSDKNRVQPNYSHVLGTLIAGGISNLYHPAASRGLSLTLTNALIDTAGNAANNLVREFLLRKVTPKVPDYEQGKH